MPQPSYQSYYNQGSMPGSRSPDRPLSPYELRGKGYMVGMRAGGGASLALPMSGAEPISDLQLMQSQRAMGAGGRRGISPQPGGYSGGTYGGGYGGGGYSGMESYDQPPMPQQPLYSGGGPTMTPQGPPDDFQGYSGYQRPRPGMGRRSNRMRRALPFWMQQQPPLQYQPQQYQQSFTD